MKLTPEEAKKIILNNCSTPPRLEEVKYLLELYEYKLKFYSKNSRSGVHIAMTQLEDFKNSLSLLIDQCKEMM